MNTILWRFLMSAVICRFILVIEIAGLRDEDTRDNDVRDENVQDDDMRKFGPANERGSAKSISIEPKTLPASRIGAVDGGD